jgi:hypothetical protein
MSTGLSAYWWCVLNGLGKVRRVPVIAAYILIQTRVGSAAAVTAALQEATDAGDLHERVARGPVTSKNET